MPKKLLLLLIGAIIFRVVALRYLPTLFFFDQARDLILVNEIVKDGNLKLLGPSASGTQDAVYHGVLYYYVLAPLQLLARGDPRIVQLLLGIINSLGIVPVTILAAKMTKSKSAGFITGLLYIFSMDAVIHNTWLSNPSIATLSVPLYLLGLWLVFIEKKTSYLWLVGLSLAASIQSAIFLGYLVIPFVVLVLLTWCKSRSLSGLNVKAIAFFFGVLAIGLSSMFLAQYKLYRVGIFSPETLRFASSSNKPLISRLDNIGSIYTQKVSLNYLNTDPVVSSLVFILVATIFLMVSSSSTVIFYLIIFASPVAFLTYLPKEEIHSIIGLEVMLLMPFGLLINRMLVQKNQLIKMLGVFVIALYIFTQLFSLHRFHKTRSYPPAVQPGMYLDDQMALLDSIYKQTAGDSFSISTFSNPYQYATVWIYLFDWYGLGKYGYKPVIAHQDQTGMFGENILEQSIKQENKHFAIIEPNLNTPDYFHHLFLGQQIQDNRQLDSTLYFDKLQLNIYK